MAGIGVQPTPRRSSQEVKAEREQKQLELKERLQVAEEAKRALAQMALEDEMAEEAVEEEGRQQLVQPNKKKNISKVSSLEEVFDLDNMSGDEEEDDSKPSGVEANQFLSDARYPTWPAVRSPQGEQAGLSLSTTIKGVEDSDENDGVTQAIVYPRANAASRVQVNSYKVPRKQAQVKLKIRAVAAQHQHGSLPVVVPACTNGPTDEYFLVQHTWVKTLQASPPSFVAIVQQAFNATHLNISYVVTAHNDIVATVFEHIKTKRSLIASDLQEVKKYAWWALRPDGPAYYANPTPMDCSLDRTSSNYVFPQGKYQSRFIIPVAKKFLSFADQSAISPKLNARNPPLGLYILILTAVERAFKSYIGGTFSGPLQFSDENVWRSMHDFRESLLRLDFE
ncbi:hypothetical protein BJY52DRAFT_1192814 [Lactarius psammicola]|nr:hypothetical protein BJY52DRAFT_1192814 [Lactarius psammicola]